jgi:beta-galactosidase
VLALLTLASTAAEKSSETAVTIGNPTEPAKLPAALQAAYVGGARDIRIAPGTYVLPATGRNTIELIAWKNVRLQAQGATIIFEELAHRPVYLKDCENVSLEGAVLRFASPAFTQGRILAMGRDDRGDHVDWQIDAGYLTDIDPTRSSLDIVDQSTRLLKTGTGDFHCATYERLGSGRFRLHQLRGGIGPAAVNDWIFTRCKSGSSIVQLDGCERCALRRVTLQNAGFAAFFETGGIGGNLYEDCRVMPGPRPADATEDQLVGCGADGFHSTGTKNGPTIVRCSWEGVLHDDCIAIHGSLQKVIRVEGNKLVLEPGNRGGFVSGEPVRISSATGYFGECTCTKMEDITEELECQELTVRITGEQETSRVQEDLRRLSAIEPIRLSCTNGAAGEFICWSVRQESDNEYVLALTPRVTANPGQGTLLEIRPQDLLKISSRRGSVGEFVCKERRATKRNQRFLEVTLDRESGAPAEAKASNPKHNGAGFKILNCKLGNCRSRGILVKGDYGLIEGNTISGCGMSAISIGPEYYWGEADYSRHVTIRGNTLAENVLNGGAAGTVYVHGEGAIGNADITIADNFFDRNYGETAIHVACSDGVRIAENRFVASPLPLPGKSRTVLHFETSRNITLQGNTVENPAPKDTLVRLGKDVEAITGNNATGIAASPRYEPPASSSIKLNFNPGWRLAKGSFAVEGAPDEGWERVSTPHTYHEAVGYQGLKKGIKDLGPHTYRKRFTVPRDYEGRRLILEFEGIRQRGQFYLNGHLLGRISHGVTPFGFDITPQVRFGAENILHVEIDCDDKDFETGTAMCWFFPGFNPLYGGITRNVFLHVVPEVHATFPLCTFLKTEGTYIYAENISTEKRTAEIGIEVQVRNDAAAARTTHCKAVLVDRDGREVASFEVTPREVKALENVTFKLRGKVGGLHFWQPGHPYLYDVYTIVGTGSGKPDVRKIVTGFRRIEVRGAEFFLNNRVLMTHGYTPRSQNEWPAIGNAYPDWLHDYANRLMVDGNSRLVRWEHIMPSPQDVTSCDRVGLPQIMPGADRENDSVGREWELRKEIMRDTMIYCRNSPSIILWEAANNVLTKEHNQEMIDLRNRWDPRGHRRPMGGRSESPEWVSWMYGVRKETYRLSVDTEFMRDESPRRWWDSWSPPYFHKEGDWKLVDNAGGWNRNQDNMCRMQSIVYEQYYRARPGTGSAVCSGGVQIFFADGDSFTRSVDTFRRSGPVDGMRIPKDAFFCNQTMWSNTPELWTEGKPSVFLPGHWNYPEGTVKPMYVFVSPGIERVELKVNGKPVPGGQRTNTFLFIFPDVKWAPGRVQAVGYDAFGKAVAEMAHETAGQPAALRLKSFGGPTGLRANGSDVVLIETELVDAAGRRCPFAANLVRYEVTGPSIWRGGIWEEDVPKYANKKQLPVLNGIHRVFVRSTTEPGTIRVRAFTEGLRPADLLIQSERVEIRDGLTTELPTVLPSVLAAAPKYGPDLPPTPAPPPGAFDAPDAASSSIGQTIFGLGVAFPGGVEIRHGAADGQRIYKDRDWVFAGLPDYLKGADYLSVANDDATTSAGEGVVFKIGKPGRVYVAYDDGNEHFPMVCSPTPFKKTEDKIAINGRTHTLYRSAAMNGGELTYIGTNNWTDKPPQRANNYVVFVQPDAR